MRESSACLCHFWRGVTAEATDHLTQQSDRLKKGTAGAGQRLCRDVRHEIVGRSGQRLRKLDKDARGVVGGVRKQTDQAAEYGDQEECLKWLGQPWAVISRHRSRVVSQKTAEVTHLRKQEKEVPSLHPELSGAAGRYA